jgi:hypothetical protein
MGFVRGGCKHKVIMRIFTNYFRLLKLAVISAMLTGSGSCRQKDSYPAQIIIAPQYESGKTYVYEVESSIFKSENPEMSRVKTVYDALLTVADAKDGLKECEWTYKKMHVKGISEEQVDPLSRMTMELMQDHAVLFKTDTAGFIAELTNYDECRNKIQTLLQEISGKDTEKIAPQVKQQVNDLLSTTTATPDALLNNYYKDVHLLFSTGADSLKPDSVYRSSSFFTLPFNQAQIPVAHTKRVSSFKNNIAEIMIEQEMTGDEYRKAMTELFREVSKKQGKPFNEAEVPQVSSKTTVTIRYDIKKKLVREISAKKITETSNNTWQTELLNLTLKQ